MTWLVLTVANQAMFCAWLFPQCKAILVLRVSYTIHTYQVCLISTGLLASHGIVLLRSLLEQEVRSKLLILIASEVSLRSLFAVEAQSTQALDRIALLFGDLDRIRSGRKRRVIVSTALRQQLEELLLILTDKLSELRVSGTELLKDRLKHLRLLLDDLSQLLELRVVTKEIEVSESGLFLLPGCGCGNRCGGSCVGASSRATLCSTTTMLRRQVKEVDIAIIIVATSSRSRARLSRSSRSRSFSLLLLLLLKVRGNSLQATEVRGLFIIKFCISNMWTHVQKVFDSAIWVEKGSAHASHDLCSVKTHSLHIGNGLLALLAHGQSIFSRRSGAGAGVADWCRCGGNGSLSRCALSWRSWGCWSLGGGRSRCGGDRARGRSSRGGLRLLGLFEDVLETVKCVNVGPWAYLVHDADNEALLFNLVGLNGFVILENLAWVLSACLLSSILETSVAPYQNR